MIQAPRPEDYLALLRLYEPQLQAWKETPNQQGLFQLAFEQVVRLLSKDSDFNHEIPLPLKTVARQYLQHNQNVIAHFSYSENRQFFLSDLYDFIQLYVKRHRHSP
jgi:hypothetical protein